MLILVNWDRMLMRNLLSPPTRFSLPRMEPLLGSSRARFSANCAATTGFPRHAPYVCQLGHGAFSSPLDLPTSYRRLNFHMR